MNFKVGHSGKHHNTEYNSGGKNGTSGSKGGGKMQEGFDEGLGLQQKAFQNSKRNKEDDIHNKAVLKGLDNAASYI